MRLDKLLTECGCGTRSEVKVLLAKGQVRIDGRIEKSPKVQVDYEKHKITVNDKELNYKVFRYYIMNKPAGYITALSDNYHKTVMDILPSWVIKKDLVPVGRLDKDTEGLLLFTNDGKLNHSLLSPKQHVEKTYYVKTRYEVEEKDIKKLESGLLILDGYMTKEAKVNKISSHEIELTIVEGKFHQVKEMLKGVGNEVLYLKRISFGKLILGNMEIGEIREIELEDIID
jgi:16S rRNA pseudouridine516 synthase